SRRAARCSAAARDDDRFGFCARPRDAAGAPPAPGGKNGGRRRMTESEDNRNSFDEGSIEESLVCWPLPDEEHTRRLAASLAPLLEPGDLLVLSGELG